MMKNKVQIFCIVSAIFLSTCNEKYDAISLPKKSIFDIDTMDLKLFKGKPVNIFLSQFEESPARFNFVSTIDSNVAGDFFYIDSDTSKSIRFLVIIDNKNINNFTGAKSIDKFKQEIINLITPPVKLGVDD